MFQRLGPVLLVLVVAAGCSSSGTPDTTAPPVTTVATTAATTTMASVTTSVPSNSTSAPTTTEAPPQFPGWVDLGLTTDYVVGAGGEIFAIGPGQEVYRYLGTPGSWENLGNIARLIAVDASGRLFLVGGEPSGVYQWSGTGQNWVAIGGPADGLWAGADELLASSPGSDGEVYRYLGIPDSWAYLGGPYMAYGITAAGDVFAVPSTQDAVLRWSGLGQQWDQVGGPAQWMWAGRGNVIARDPATGDTFRYGGVPGDWTRIGPRFSDIAISADGEVFALSEDQDRILRWSGSGDVWEEIGGGASYIYAVYGGICGISQMNGHVWCHFGN